MLCDRDQIYMEKQVLYCLSHALILKQVLYKTNSKIYYLFSNCPSKLYVVLSLSLSVCVQFYKKNYQNHNPKEWFLGTYMSIEY